MFSLLVTGPIIAFTLIVMSVLSPFSELQGPTFVREATPVYLAPEGDFSSKVAATPSTEQWKLSIPYQTRGSVELKQLEWCENLLARSFAVLPPEHIQSIHSLTLSFDPHMRRGLAGGNKMIIRCVDVEEKELVAVLTHELGHIVDTGFLNAHDQSEQTTFVDRGAPVASSDPSTQFYTLSWEDNRTKKGQSSDFISGYSRELVYEEFAETYAAYILHGQLFRFYAAHNPILAQKYAFFKNTVFQGKEYDLPEALPPIVESEKRVYDLTRLEFDLERFWALSH